MKQSLVVPEQEDSAIAQGAVRRRAKFMELSFSVNHLATVLLIYRTSSSQPAGRVKRFL